MLRIGTGVRMRSLRNRVLRERYPVLARAILAGASGSIRNMGDGLRQHPAAYPLYLLL